MGIINSAKKVAEATVISIATFQEASASQPHDPVPVVSLDTAYAPDPIKFLKVGASSHNNITDTNPNGTNLGRGLTPFVLLAASTAVCMGLKKAMQRPLEKLKDYLKHSEVLRPFFSVFLGEKQSFVKISEVKQVAKAVDNDAILVLGVQANGHYYIIVGNSRVDTKPLCPLMISDLREDKPPVKRLKNLFKGDSKGLSDNGIYFTFDLTDEMKERLKNLSDTLQRKSLPGMSTLYGCADQCIFMLEKIGIFPNGFAGGHRLGFDPYENLKSMTEPGRSEALFIDKYGNKVSYEMHNPYNHELSKLMHNARGMMLQGVATTAFVAGSAYLFFNFFY